MANTILQNWILHRCKSIQLTWPDGVADAACVAPTTLDTVAQTGNLRYVGRSTRSYLARALKVSVRELEALDDGRLKWIGDERVVDFDRHSVNAMRVTVPPAPIPTACPKGRGVPILGRIIDSGTVEQFEDWTAEDGPRLPVRYPGIRDPFSLMLEADLPLYSAGVRLVFQVIPPGELIDGEMALLTHGDGDVECELCIVRRDGQILYRQPIFARGGACIAIGEVPRAARVIGNHYTDSIDSMR